MNKRLSSVFVVVLAASLAPTATFADVAITAPVTTRCAAAVQTASLQQARLEVVQNRQLTALDRVNRRLQNLLEQTASQGRSLAVIQADNAELTQRISSLTAAYKTLNAAVIATGAQCGAATSMAAAQDELVTVRNEVASLETWYLGQLSQHLNDLAAGK